MIYIEGMGMIGSVLAHTLRAKNIDFTWWDNDTRFSAWPASAGSIVPSMGSLESYTRWRQAPALMQEFIETADFWYTSQTAPGSGRKEHDVDLGSCRRHAFPSLHLNVQEFVKFTRIAFIGARSTCARSVGGGISLHIQAHGFTTCRAWGWGWTALAELRGTETLPKYYGPGVGGVPRRPALYARPSRYEVMYAYPYPGHPTLWRVGSDHVTQTKAPRSRKQHLGECIVRWQQRFAKSFEPGISIERMQCPIEGWRPMSPEEHAKMAGGNPKLVFRQGDTIQCVGLGRFGVRWAFEAVDHICELL